MTENERDTQHTLYDQSPVNDGNRTISPAALLADLEQVFTEARPRLLRLAHLNGMSPDMADDVVQETMMEAWRHVEKLRDPQRFYTWLDGICRNVCRRYKTPAGTLHRHFSLSNPARDNETKNASDASLALPDPFDIDPAEEVSRQDLAILLDRAMEHLSPDTRKLLEMCYLAEIPQREAALQLGLTIGALELRLHRARTLGEVSRDDNALTLQVPTDGSVRSLRAVLDRLDHESIAVNDLSIHTPDLDDVFFALTGHPDTQKGTVR